jgi:hypothetical protein
MAMKVAALTVVVLAALLLLACGGGKEGEGAILHLEGWNISETDYRAIVRATLVGLGGEDFCKGLQGLSPTEILDIMAGNDVSGPNAEAPAGATPVPNQTADPDDGIRMATIIKEECERILQ